MSCHQRDAAAHTARLQVGWYILYMAVAGGVGRWWSDATIASDILVWGLNPKSQKSLIVFWLTDDGQKSLGK